MLERADVFIQNLSPSAAQKLKLDAQSVHQRFPSLIVCAISGYGRSGPYSNQKAYDLLVQAEAGLCEINGSGDSKARVGLSVCDIAAGQAAHQSILQALFARERFTSARSNDSTGPRTQRSAEHSTQHSAEHSAENSAEHSAEHGTSSSPYPGRVIEISLYHALAECCLLYTSPSPRDGLLSRMPSSA